MEAMKLFRTECSRLEGMLVVEDFTAKVILLFQREKRWWFSKRCLLKG
jgi:hypothetical protein